MRLLVIRHARAVGMAEFAGTGASDDLRPLTDEGRERMRAAAAGLHRIVGTLDVLATSPLLRARQTADVLLEEFGAPQVTELDELRPDSPAAAFVEWIREAGAEETVAIVGHELQLEELIGLLLTGRPDAVVKLKKGGAVMLELKPREGSGPGPRGARLLWALTPRQLRMLCG